MGSTYSDEVLRGDVDGDGTPGNIITEDETNKRIGVNNTAPGVTVDIKQATGDAHVRIDAVDAAAGSEAIYSARVGGLTVGRFYANGPSFSPSGAFKAYVTGLFGDKAGGVSIAATEATGDVRIYTGGSADANLRLSIDQDGVTTLNGQRVDVHEETTSVLGAAATSLDMVLDGTEDACELIVFIVGAADDYCQLRINGATTNLAYQSASGDGGIGIGTNARIVNVNNGGMSYVRVLMQTKAQGNSIPRWGVSEGANRTSGPAFNIWHRSNIVWQETSTAITSIGIEIGTASGLGQNTVAFLRKIRRYV